jgi:hypothetical protein
MVLSVVITVYLIRPRREKFALHNRKAAQKQVSLLFLCETVYGGYGLIAPSQSR